MEHLRENHLQVAIDGPAGQEKVPLRESLPTNLACIILIQVRCIDL